MKHPNPSDSMTSPSDQERLMALLALTAQALPQAPPSSEIAAQAADAATQAQFRALDADPVALEAYLRAGMRKSQPSRAALQRDGILQSLVSWIAPPQLRWAAAAAVAVLGVAVVWQLSSQSLLGEVERSFAESDLQMPVEGLILPWERQANVQTFSGVRGNETLQGRAFAAGLRRGRALLVGATGQSAQSAQSVRRASDEFSKAKHYVALGEWNVLLWSASESNAVRDADFWRTQLTLARKFVDQFDKEDARTEKAHLSTTVALVDAMVRAPDRRAAQGLATELERFREAFAPLEAGAAGPPP